MGRGCLLDAALPALSAGEAASVHHPASLPRATLPYPAMEWGRRPGAEAQPFCRTLLRAGAQPFCSTLLRAGAQPFRSTLLHAAPPPGSPTSPRTSAAPWTTSCEDLLCICCVAVQRVSPWLPWGRTCAPLHIPMFIGVPTPVVSARPLTQVPRSCACTSTCELPLTHSLCGPTPACAATPLTRWCLPPRWSCRMRASAAPRATRVGAPNA